MFHKVSGGFCLIPESLHGCFGCLSGDRSGREQESNPLGARHHRRHVIAEGCCVGLDLQAPLNWPAFDVSCDQLGASHPGAPIRVNLEMIFTLAVHDPVGFQALFERFERFGEELAVRQRPDCLPLACDANFSRTGFFGLLSVLRLLVNSPISRFGVHVVELFHSVMIDFREWHIQFTVCFDSYTSDRVSRSS